MGLPVSVHVRGAESVRRPSSRVAAVFAELRRADAVFSPYRDDSDLSRWDRGELALADADPTLAEVVALGERGPGAHRRLVRPAGPARPAHRPPRYDPSGLVKGWAVQRAARHLAELDGHGWCLNAGGDVLVYAPTDQPPWRVGIEDPDDPERDPRGSSNGGTARWPPPGPPTGAPHRWTRAPRRPATGVRAVTVIGPELLWADVYATAAAVRGPGALPWLEDLEGYEALLVAPSGLVHTTTGWPGG